MSDDLDKVVEGLKRKAVVPITLTEIPIEFANAVDPGLDEEFLQRLKRGDHFNDDFLKDDVDQSPAVDPGLDVEFFERLERGDYFNGDFLKGFDAPSPR